MKMSEQDIAKKVSKLDRDLTRLVKAVDKTLDLIDERSDRLDLLATLTLRHMTEFHGLDEDGLNKKVVEGLILLHGEPVVAEAEAELDEEDDTNGS